MESNNEFQILDDIVSYIDDDDLIDNVFDFASKKYENNLFEIVNWNQILKNLCDLLSLITSDILSWFNNIEFFHENFFTHNNKLFDFIMDLSNLVKTSEFESVFKSKTEIQHKTLICYIYLLILFSMPIYRLKCNDTDFENILNDFDKFEETLSCFGTAEVKGNTYYRGHSNSHYKLIPSFYRNKDLFASFSSSSGEVILKNTDIFNIYNIRKMVDKYNNILESKGTVSLYNMNYEFLSFMQH